MKELIIFYIVTIIFLIIDVNGKYKTCIDNKPMKILPVIILHRIIFVFMYLGWIFNNKIILYGYLVFMLILLIHWSMNNWKCCLTQYENSVCDFSKNSQYDILLQNLSYKSKVFVSILTKILLISLVIIKIMM